MSSEALRPDPDKLLDLVSQDRSLSPHGRLKIFFGASAGVGKTYAMLQEAQRYLQEGLDVVTGIIETHGRKETAALAADIPTIAPHMIPYRGSEIPEFDLEAALERKPSLILMDELAHSNIPGSRHSKRWQDVEELLAMGIDVYTTLNVQHLESINDMVTKLTGVIVRETVPDHLLDKADEVALIDIPSEELLKRLAEGKVYIAPGANQRAAENFFKKTNLVALRELALRRTAERVDAEGEILTAAFGMKETQTGHKILVSVGHDLLSSHVIRHAKRMANRAKAPWTALYVETARHERLSDTQKLSLDRNLRLGEKMGAKIVRISGTNASEEIVNYAQTHGITRIVVGHRKRTRLHRFFQPGSLATDLIELVDAIEVTAITDVSDQQVPIWQKFRSFLDRVMTTPSNYGHALIILALSTLLGYILLPYSRIEIIPLIYLTAVTMTAAWCGTGPSIMASLGSAILYRSFFLKTASFVDIGFLSILALMLLTSLVVGNLASILSLQATQARKREQETSVFYTLTRELSSARGMKKLSNIVLRNVREAFGMDAVLFIPTGGRVDIIPPNSHGKDVKEETVARWVMRNKQIAGSSTDTLPSARGLYIPLQAEDQVMGVLGLIPQDDDYNFQSHEINRLETFASLIASAFQRSLKAAQAETSRLESEAEKLRSVLLSSVSHDLRTPLATLSGAASAALLYRDKLPKTIFALINSIHTQAVRLSRSVTNLLDVSALESGSVKLNLQPYPIEKLISSALTRTEKSLNNKTITTNLEPELPEVMMDVLLIEQVLVNLLDNAIRYSEPDGKIEISANLQDDQICVSVSDNGSGLQPEEEISIFDKSDPKQRSDGSVGLGLTICRGIVTAHHGVISARNRSGDKNGAVFSFILPITQDEHDLSAN